MKFSLRSLFCLLPNLALMLGCGPADDPITPAQTNSVEIRASDLSSLPLVRDKGIEYLNENGEIEDVLSILQRFGLNTVRVRLWHNPIQGRSGLKEVQEFASEIRNHDMDILLSIHYSDTWADPGNQSPPPFWQNIPFEDLKDSVFQYTSLVAELLSPELVQIGNEINNGLLFPYGEINTDQDQFLSLVSEGIKAVRQQSPSSRIILHYAGFNGSELFFSKVDSLDFDIIGLSYYPTWHGSDLDSLREAMHQLQNAFQRDILLAETAYPFTLDWNDWTDNIVGLESQLILPKFPATPLGQRNFISRLFQIIQENERGIGVCYWGGELVAFDGPQSKNGSPWENQALFDFNNRALPVIQTFKNLVQ